MSLFKPITNFERYEINDRCVIRRADTGRLLKPWRDGKYMRVELRKAGKSHNRRVHRLLLETFLGPEPELEACHCNGDSLDNRLSNLYWGTHQDNMLDKVRHGTHHNARKTHCKRGHEFTPENTRVRIQGTWILRRCRSCETINARELRARNATA